MSDALLVDAVGRRRSKVTLPGYLAGRAPHNKGMRYPADPPRVEEIIAVMRQAGEDRHGLRIRAVIAVLLRAGPRISEALALSETDVEPPVEFEQLHAARTAREDRDSGDLPVRSVAGRAADRLPERRSQPESAQIAIGPLPETSAVAAQGPGR